MTAINKAVTVNLGKAEVELLFDWNALAALEEKSGKSLAELFGERDKETGEIVKPGTIATAPLSTVRLLVWAGAQRQMPGTSIEDIGGLMDFESIQEISSAVIGAFAGATGSSATTAV